MNGIENSTRFGVGGLVATWGWERLPPDRDRESGKEKTNPQREWHFGRRGARHGGGWRATRGDGNGGKTNLRVARANDVSTVRPTGAITGGILQSLRLYLRGSGTSPVCLRHVLKMITICIYMYMYIRIHRLYVRRDCRQNRPSAVPIENHSVECRQSKDREPVETDLSRPAGWQWDR